MAVLRRGLDTGLKQAEQAGTASSAPSPCFVFSRPYSVEGLSLLSASLLTQLSFLSARSSLSAPPSIFYPISASVWTAPMFSKPFYCTAESPKDLVKMQILIQ